MSTLQAHRSVLNATISSSLNATIEEGKGDSSPETREKEERHVLFVWARHCGECRDNASHHVPEKRNRFAIPTPIVEVAKPSSVGAAELPSR